MTLKGIFKNSSFLVQCIMLIAVAFFGIIASSLLFYLFLALKGGFNIELLSDPNILLHDAGMLRTMQFFQSLGTFFFPALFLGYLYSDDQKAYLSTEVHLTPRLAILIVASMIVVLPFLNLTVYLNEIMVLPDWLKPLEDWMATMEEQNREITETMLGARNVVELIFNIVIVGVIAGVGEEFMFRGVMQNVFRKVLRNEHIIIWSVAIIFSSIHLQFYGFIPRMLMGVYFGYLLYYTKSIWAPVLAHFTNNAIGVVSYYNFQNTDNMDQLDSIGTRGYWWVGIISLILWAIIFRMIIKGTRCKVQGAEF